MLPEPGGNLNLSACTVADDHIAVTHSSAVVLHAVYEPENLAFNNSQQGMAAYWNYVSSGCRWPGMSRGSGPPSTTSDL